MEKKSKPSSKNGPLRKESGPSKSHDLELRGEEENEGEALVEEVIALSGLPDEAARSELDAILQHSNLDDDDLTLEDLRQALIVYLEKQIELTSPDGQEH